MHFGLTGLSWQDLSEIWARYCRIVVGMILINRLSPTIVFLSFGLFYLITGYYYRLPVPVQPLKAVGAIAIANPALITEPVIGAAGVIFGAMLLLFSVTGFVDKLAKLFTQPVVRGIQLALGLVFLRMIRKAKIKI